MPKPRKIDVTAPVTPVAEKNRAPKKGQYEAVLVVCRELSTSLNRDAVERRPLDGNITKISRVEGAKLVLQHLNGDKLVTVDNLRDILGV